MLDLKPDLTFDLGFSHYDNGIPAEKRQFIIDEFNWDIRDGGSTGVNNQQNYLRINVVPNYGGIATGAGFYNSGEVIELNAVSNPLHTFSHWETNAGVFVDNSSANTLFTMPDEFATITAYFVDAAPDDDAFYFLVETTSTETQYKFLIDDAVNFEVEWQAGQTQTYSGNVMPQHNFNQAGVWAIKVKGQASRISFYTGNDLDFQSTSCNYAPMLRDILTPISSGITGITNAHAMFRNTRVESFTSANFFDDISTNVTDMSWMFLSSLFIQDISNWDVSNVTTMANMFGRSSFNSDITDWNTSNVEDMTGMFYGNNQFNQDIGQWNVGNVKNMALMFMFASVFNQPIGGWDVSKVKRMEGMFSGATVFNQNIGEWDVSNVENMEALFGYTSDFNQDLNSWDVGNVTNMARMFWNSNFNQPIGDWDVSKVTNMQFMFFRSPFNQDIGNWNVGNVTDMGWMFFTPYPLEPHPFNQDIGSWDVSNVNNMPLMFSNSKFNQDISDWDVSNVHSFTSFLEWSELSSDNYNKLLINWSNLNLKENVRFHGGNSKYDLGLPEERRQYIIDTFGWEITDGGSTGEEYEE